MSLDTKPKLSVVIICWNDLKCLGPCLASVYAETSAIPFEVILTDNASTDGSVAFVRDNFPTVRIVENGRNLGYGPGNNAGFQVARGEYVLILNPDTLIHERALERLVAYADRHPEAGAFGCRVINLDGSFQGAAQPRPTILGSLLGALCLRWLGRLSRAFDSDQYPGWDGRTERAIGFQAGCCLLVRRALLQQLGGFDERFLHQFEDADLCHRVWDSGQAVLYCPQAEVTHIGGRNRGGYPIKVILETQRSKYRYFHKHYGPRGALLIRWVSLIEFGLRYAGYRLLGSFRSRADLPDRLRGYRVLLRWHWRINPIRFLATAEEPALGYEPLAGERKAEVIS